MQKLQEKKLVIELRRPEDELHALENALQALSQPGLSREDAQRLRRVVKQARAYGRLFKAYVAYLNFCDGEADSDA